MGWSVRFCLLWLRYIQRHDIYLCARRIFVVEHAASIVSSHDFAVVIRQHTVMRQHIIDRLEQVHQVYAAMVASEEAASDVARLVNLDSSFIWDVRSCLLLKVLEAFAGRHKGPTLGRV